MFQYGGGRIDQRHGRGNGQLQQYAGGGELEELRRENELLRIRLERLLTKLDGYKRDNDELRQEMGYPYIGGGGGVGRGGLGRLY